MGEFVIQVSDHRRNLIGIYGPYTWEQARNTLEATLGTTNEIIREIVPLNPADAMPLI